MMAKLKVLVPVGLLLAVLFTTLLYHNCGTWLVFAADTYGNQIDFIEVWEDTTLKANFTSGGGSVSVNASKQLKFVIGIRFNSTLASSQSEAVAYTRVYMNITYNGNFVWQNKELNNTSVSGPSGGFYWLKEEGILPPNTLSEGKIYACSVLYQGYY
ncbi:MAG: hypothetical protein QXL54_03235 [Candidatus Bathyarchaeia archaeon]